MKSTITLMGSGPLKRLRVQAPYSPVLVGRFGLIPGHLWHPEEKAWSFPLAPDVLAMVCDVCGILPSLLPPEVREEAGGFRARPQALPDLSLTQGHSFVTEPYQHQRTNLARLLQNERWLLADEQGTGKSHAVANVLKHVYHAAHERRLSGETNFTWPRALILCPKSVMYGWSDQLMLHARLVCRLWGDNSAWSPILVANYEALLHDKLGLFGEPWDVVVFDEVQRVKSFAAKTSRAARRLSEQAARVYALSGTPAPNGLEDWLGVLSAVKPDLLPCRTKKDFEDRYLIKGSLTRDGRGPRVVQGYRNVAELHQYVSSITSRVTKAECLDLPAKVYSTRQVRLEGEQARVYKELKRDAVARLKSRQGEGTLTVTNVLTESLRLLQVVGGFVPDDDGHTHELGRKAKVDALAEVLEEVGERQVVVWCAFRQEVEWLRHWLQALTGGGAVCLTGQTPGALRPVVIEKFSSGDARFFVATASAGGTGINGLEVADTQVYYSRDWNLATYLQSQDRLHRIGQKNAVSVVKLLATATVDQKVDDALERKASLQAMMLETPVEELL